MLAHILLSVLELGALNGPTITGSPLSLPALCTRQASQPVVFTLNNPPPSTVVLKVKVADGDTKFSVDGGSFTGPAVTMVFSPPNLTHSLRLKTFYMGRNIQVAYTPVPPSVTFATGQLETVFVANPNFYDLAWPGNMGYGTQAAYNISACGSPSGGWSFVPTMHLDDDGLVLASATPLMFDPTTADYQSAAVNATRVGVFGVHLHAAPSYWKQAPSMSGGGPNATTRVTGIIMPPLAFDDVYVGDAEVCLPAEARPSLPQLGSCGLVACPEGITLTAEVVGALHGSSYVFRTGDTVKSVCVRAPDTIVGKKVVVFSLTSGGGSSLFSLPEGGATGSFKVKARLHVAALNGSDAAAQPAILAGQSAPALVGVNISGLLAGQKTVEFAVALVNNTAGVLLPKGSHSVSFGGSSARRTATLTLDASAASVVPGSFVLRFACDSGTANCAFFQEVLEVRGVVFASPPTPLPTPPPSSPSFSASLVVAGGFMLLLFGAAIVRRRRRQRKFGNSGAGLNQESALNNRRGAALLSDAVDPYALRGDEWLIDLNQLEFGEEIGAGVSAQVFRGAYYGHEVAVKRMHSSLWEQDKFDEFFKAEAKMLKSLNHPNVVRFFGAAFDPATERGYLVTEFAAKGSLSGLLAEHNPPRSEVMGARCFFSLMLGVARGMEFVHARGCVHRDLKPDNVLLSASDEVKLCDFGLSRGLERDATTMTSGVGTPAYMAVELITASDVVACDSSIDVFSMGVLMWTVWTREVPYAREALTPFTLMSRLIAGMRPTLPAAGGEGAAPPRLAELMRRCWRTEPAERPTFSEVRAELAVAAAEVGEEMIVPGMCESVDEDGLVVTGQPRDSTCGAGEGSDCDEDEGAAMAMSKISGSLPM